MSSTRNLMSNTRNFMSNTRNFMNFMSNTRNFMSSTRNFMFYVEGEEELLLPQDHIFSSIIHICNVMPLVLQA